MRLGLPAHPSSVGRARRLVRAHLKGTALEPLSETAELAVSEVVTNAIVHTGADIELATWVEPATLRVEVADSGAHLPQIASYEAIASTGRGLRLVADLVDQWGVQARPGGKVIWFQLGLDARTEENHGAGMSITGAEPPGAVVPGHVVEVLLLDLPALVHGAWQQHAKSLLRDFLLSGLESEADLAAEASQEMETHAAAMDALAILEEQVGTPEASEDPAELLVSAVEPHATWKRQELSVPVESVPHFDVLDHQMEAALAQAHAGRLLTPPTQPEFAAFRRWLCEQVRVQAAGGPPRQWVTPAHPLPAAATSATQWDGSAVNHSSRALIAANDAGLIVAASSAAAALLKYDATDDLVGRRLVEIIPTRYHQAHLAGFTLHQLTGRSPLLQRPAVVPALCRDGSEVEVPLQISTSPGPGGGSIFVADLDLT